MFERVGDDGLQNSGRGGESQIEITLCEGVAAIGIGALQNGADLVVVNEFKAPRSRLFSGRGYDRAVVRLRERCYRLTQNPEQLLHDLSGGGAWAALPSAERIKKAALKAWASQCALLPPESWFMVTPQSSCQRRVEAMLAASEGLAASTPRSCCPLWIKASRWER